MLTLPLQMDDLEKHLGRITMAPYIVKAMALIDPYGLTPTGDPDPIQQCYNSQLPAAQATQGDCGMRLTRLTCCGSDAWWRLDFGFRVDDRFVSVTSAADDRSDGDSTAAVFRSRFGIPNTAWDISLPDRSRAA